MNIVLWILQVALAVMFAMAGFMKTTQPMAKLAPQMPWTEDVSPPTVRFIGAVELLGALGLILPAATGIATVLTPAAATGLAVTMALAVALHIRRKEPSGIATAGVLLVVAAIVAWGRFGPYSF
jgi:uncharacterized membrane protein YphA (DoxX/SURF4 family)